ncbi:unnamed protein product [Euphydryas editha]|uniref:Uncharacterized protein n=1 Tax=Euphydryas editha TaxID=104508 RepID=A0AAU9TSH6_EUPED|nr:unnamed protein product [Euphydryas editha]
MNNLLRSPNGGGICRGSSDSQLNMSAVSDNSQVTFRNKRKLHSENDRIMDELSDLKKQMADMIALISSTSSAQTENIDKLCRDVTAIRNEVNSVSNTMASMTIEQDKLRTDIHHLVTSTQDTKKRVTLLESDVNELKLSATQNSNKMLVTCESYEKLINECQERNERRKNIILAGITESTAENNADRTQHDLQEVSKVIKLLNSDCPEPQQIFRLGRYQSNKSRLIKVCFSSEKITKQLLRKKTTVQLNNIKIYSDQTPYQREVLKNLQKELQQRTANGECNLRIKYEKGIPKIIKIDAKNFTATVTEF